MKILHITHTDILSDSRILKEIMSLDRAGHKVFGIGVGRVLNKQSELPENIDILGINIISRKFTFLPRFIRHIVTFIEMLFKMITVGISFRPDVVHCHDTLALLFGIIIKIYTRSIIIYDAHELESDKNSQSRVSSWITRNFESIVWKFIHSIIVVSPSIKDWYLTNLGDKNSIVILNSPVFSTEEYIRTNYLRARYSIPLDKKVYIYVGAFVNGRGIELILNVFRLQSIDSHVVFLGYGDLRDLLVKSSIENNKIHVHDSVPHAQVVPIVRSADYGLCMVESVSLSDYFCLPNKLFEYGFAGIPVVASNFPDISEYVERYNLGFCCDVNFESIADAILNPKVNSKTWISKDLEDISWEQQEFKLIELYKNIGIKH